MNKEFDRYKYIFHEILKMTDDGFIVIDKNGIITDINDQYCDFLGTAKEDAIGIKISEIISNTKMLDIVNKRYHEEGAIHKFIDGDTKEEVNNFLLVSRSHVLDDNDNVIAGVAQVKFRLQTLDSAKKLMKEYSELQFYKEEYNKREYNKYTFDGMIGENKEFLELKKTAMKCSKTNFSVLITGETGTGKEVFAQSIHKNSQRREKPIVSINCAAIPSELLESELFGYEEGSFTGAKKGGKQGKFELSDGGTIFLDEIGDMPLGMQAKILRVLQENEVQKIGANNPIPIDLRVISATRKDLQKMVSSGEFREDLYYRLNVININVTPLRERREDIALFINCFLNKLNKEYKTLVTIDDDALVCLQNYDWPGNIRELENTIKSAYASSENMLIQLEDLQSKMVSLHNEKVLRDSVDKRLKRLVDNYEISVIKESLKRNGYNMQCTAEELGIHRSLLYKKIKKYDIEAQEIM
ncbi:sigma 54-interacting transcriptional regulator [Clostridium sp.]|uniref:sigma-54 interaction domain-containing protein n=1 Tax=Clostridium sp. TaxID=1506 RepID=UPI001A3A40DD|nr:sigma 54-interacting transcriptional regulator [Clostridium sp.]MBK5242172.1 sigma 54-interacting transcriptional regulator [Clostridium sp.]